MAFWDQTGDADGSTSGNYFPPIEAEYDIEIDAVKHKGAGYKGESVIVEMRAISSNVEQVPAGSSRSAAWNISKQPVLALNNIKSFVCGIYGLVDSAKDPDTKQKVNHVSKRMVEMDNPLRGVRVHLSTFGKKTAKGTDFTVMDWSPYIAEPGYVPPVPSASASLAAPPPPPPAERYYPEGTAPGRGATHRLVNGAWVGL